MAAQLPAGRTRPQRRGWDDGRLPGWAPRHAPHLTVRSRFALSVIAGLLWATLSTLLALPWLRELADTLTLPVAIAIIAGIAVVPGYLNAQLLVALAFDRPRPLDRVPLSFPPISVLTAAYNEEASIEATVTRVLGQDYPGELHVIVIDDGSTDRTPQIVGDMARRDARVRLLRADHGGKAAALNLALAGVRTRLLATVDADTLLMPQSLRRAAARLLLSPPDMVAVAGAVMVRNPRVNLMTRMQDWDYLLGIASVKRQQSLVNGTLVAQGAFSVYDTKALHRAGGWPDMIGEDIVLTWSMLHDGGRATFEATAVAFTGVPETLGAFARQRRRWARGMIEGLREYGGSLVNRRRLYSYAVGVNWGFPYLDFIFTFVWIPGLLLALTGNFLIVGPMALAVLPITTVMSLVMFTRQRAALAAVGLRTRRNWSGLAAYILGYQLLMSPISVAGYVQEVTRVRRNW
jgi:biofilm PGA synthesis N-glycosyltransferase PgaC